MRGDRTKRFCRDCGQSGTAMQCVGEREREREGVKARATFCNRRIYIYRASDGAERKVNGKLEKYSTTEFCELVYS